MEKLSKETKIFVFFKTSKQYEFICWLHARVILCDINAATRRRLRKGFPMLTAYDDTRIAPKGYLARELMHASL